MAIIFDFPLYAYILVSEELWGRMLDEYVFSDPIFYLAYLLLYEKVRMFLSCPVFC